MSNFTKSIFYSGTVLAIGLIAVFTIYNSTIGTDASSVSSIEPAAGVEFGAFQETVAQTTDAITNAVETLTEKAAEMATETMDAIPTTDEAITPEAIETAIKDMAAPETNAMDNTQTIAEVEADAQAHTLDATEPAAGDAMIKTIETKIGD